MALDPKWTTCSKCGKTPPEVCHFSYGDAVLGSCCMPHRESAETICFEWFPFTDGNDICDLPRGHEGKHSCSIDNGYFRCTLTWEKYR